MTLSALRQYKASFQLYSTRAASDREEVLEALASIGYDAVEPWPMDYRDSPTRFRKQIEAVGLECLGFHLPFHDFIDHPERYFDIALTLGASPLMIIPNLIPSMRPCDAEGWRRIGGRLGERAALARSRGLRLAWHNHEYEFKRLPTGERPLDLMLESAGEDFGLEIDLAWVTRAWEDPALEFERFASRIVAIQVKDTAPPGTSFEQGWTAPGDGIIDWDRLWPLFATAPADHLVVEHDAPEDWRLTARRSFEFLTVRSAGKHAKVAK